MSFRGRGGDRGGRGGFRGSDRGGRGGGRGGFQQSFGPPATVMGMRQSNPEPVYYTSHKLT